MSLVSRLFGTPGLLCPRCERALDGHDDAACARKMSRRWFIGVTLGATASAIVAPAAVCQFARLNASAGLDAIIRPGDRLSVDFTGTSILTDKALISVLLERKDGNGQTVRILPFPAFKDQTVFIADSDYQIKDIRMVTSNENIVLKPAIRIRRNAPMVSVVRG